MIQAIFYLGLALGFLIGIFATITVRYIFKLYREKVQKEMKTKAMKEGIFR